MIELTIEEAKIILRALDGFSNETGLDLLEEEMRVYDKLNGAIEISEGRALVGLPPQPFPVAPPPSKFEEDEYGPAT